MSNSPQIREKTESFEIEIQNKKKQFFSKEMPKDFIDWQINERIKLFGFLKEKKRPVFFTPHLPTLLTENAKRTDFPINAVCKGVGLVPIDNKINELTKRMGSLLKQIDISDFDKSLEKRIKGMMLLYGSPEKINRFSLGGLEIFETQSYNNILKNPFVSLFFVGPGPQYKSYQFNCIAELTPATDRFYSFLITIRKLFEEAPFHFQQPAYPFAIKYHIIEVLDKSLKIRGK
jgi:hypothetical protein